MTDHDGHMLVCQRSAHYEEAACGTSLLDVFLLFIYIGDKLHITDGKLSRVVDQRTVYASLVGTLDMTELVVAGLQGLLVTQVLHAAGILHLGHSDGRTTVRQLVGAHLGQHARHVAQLVLILHLRPLVTAVRQVFIVVLTLVVLGVK